MCLGSSGPVLTAISTFRRRLLPICDSCLCLSSFLVGTYEGRGSLPLIKDKPTAQKQRENCRILGRRLLERVAAGELTALSGMMRTSTPLVTYRAGIS
jgi:hypothetical protein